MKYLIHPVNTPRSLDLRFQLPVGNPTTAWDNFQGKTKVHEALLPAQNYLCSYCEIELDRSNGGIGFHIEHIKPKSLNPALTFEFNNLLISCFNSGHEIPSSNDDSMPISCGHAKGDGFAPLLFIKPTEYNCENYFFYELDGRIVPNPNLTGLNESQRAEYTIQILNLNCRRLKRERRDMIKAGLEIINDFLDDFDSLSYFINCELEETNNKYRSFITTRRQYFQDLIN